MNTKFQFQAICFAFSMGVFGILSALVSTFGTLMYGPLTGPGHRLALIALVMGVSGFALIGAGIKKAEKLIAFLSGKYGQGSESVTFAQIIDMIATEARTT